MSIEYDADVWQCVDIGKFNYLEKGIYAEGAGSPMEVAKLVARRGRYTVVGRTADDQPSAVVRSDWPSKNVYVVVLPHLDDSVAVRRPQGIFTLDGELVQGATRCLLEQLYIDRQV